MATLQRRRLGRAIAGYLVATIAIITLVPFTIRWPEVWRLTGFVTVSDLVQNIALFVPLGFAVAFGGGRPTLTGAVVSVAVEVAQQFIPGRFSSHLDVATNTLGALLGGLTHQALSRGLGRRHQGVGVRALDLPLMGTVYLIVPLVWLVGLSQPSSPGRLWLVCLPLLAGAIVLGSVSRHHLEPKGVARGVAGLAAGGWAAVALLPGWHGRWRWIVGFSLAAFVVTVLLARLVAATEEVGRRFEGVTVRRAVAPLVIFLIVAAAWPLETFDVGWTWTVGWSGSTESLSREGILQVLELMAGCTVIGYGIAESRSRAVEPAERTRWVLGLIALGVAAAVELVRARHTGRGGSVPEAGLLAAATAFGGSLYARQRDYVLALLGRLPAGPAGPLGAAGSYGRMVPPVPADGTPKWK